MANNETIAMRHFMLSDSFLQLVENVLNETLKTGNTDIYSGPPRKDIQAHYRHITKWSGSRILIPILFNFFHGIELLLKAANYKVTPPSKSPNHKLSKLIADFKNNYPNSTRLATILDKYIYPIQANTSLLSAFYLSNNIIDSSQFYDIFKYPFTKDFQIDFDYKDLHNSGKEGINLFQQIVDDIQIIRLEIEGL